MDLIIEIGIVALLAMGITVCITILVILLKLVPPALRTIRNLEKITEDFAGVSDSVASDIAGASHNAATASENMVRASEDFCTAAAALASLGRLNVPMILAEVAQGQIKNVRELAGFVGRNWPATASRIGSFFSRGP